jgi:hypothetical protein
VNATTRERVGVSKYARACTSCSVRVGISDELVVAACAASKHGVDKVTLGKYGARMSNEERAMNAEKQLATFFAKYEPPIAKLGKALRARLRERLPGLFEIVYVYESQSSLVISYSSSEIGKDGVCSLAVYPSGVKLFFSHGPQLSKSDPSKLLQGRGKMVRYVEMSSVADFDRDEIEVLTATALKLAKVSLDPSAKGSVIIKAEEQKQRARRAKKAARPASKSRASKAQR